MRSAIIDSSSAILLNKCKMIPALLKYSSPVIPGTVMSELTVPGYDGADLFTGLCASGDIKVCKPSAEKTDELPGSLHAGEREVIALFYEGKGDFIIIDDGRGGAYCRDNNIPYINALVAVKILYISGIITEAEFFSAWRWLLQNGRYSRKVTDWAENADEHILAAFL